jgi:hypothetical protein
MTAEAACCGTCGLSQNSAQAFQEGQLGEAHAESGLTGRDSDVVR